MKSKMMFDYPKKLNNIFEYPIKLNNIFDKLDKYASNIIIVGGFVRDSFLGIKSKDIDIEVYGLESFEVLQTLLQEFAKVSSVGKSFGVCKLNYEGYDLDFSLPRYDNKISSGHAGFEVDIDPNMDFKTASFRRDFTINTIGFNVMKKEFIDPYNGIMDIKNSVLKAVNNDTFIQDPLRVYRAIQFSSRFEFKLDDNLFKLCETMIEERCLEELSLQRIIEELKKLLLKSSKPSIGLRLLEKLNIEIFNTNSKILTLIDNFSSLKTQDIKTDFIIYMTLLYSNNQLYLDILNTSKALKREVLRLKCIENYILKQSVTINYNEAKNLDLDLANLYFKTIELNINLKYLKPRINGKDLLARGYKPSKEFTAILQKSYNSQLNEYV
jgi:tRNA nucleotidyltransferase (CCA-adding enzyme)